jgi:hypothetical protein
MSSRAHELNRFEDLKRLGFIDMRQKAGGLRGLCGLFESC